MSKTKRKWINLNFADTPNALRAEDIPYDGSDSVKEAIDQAASVSAGSGIAFFMDDSSLIATGANNDNELNELFKYPAGGSEVADTISCTSNTVLGEAYLYNTALESTKIDAGEWDFITYCSVNSTVAGRESSLTRNAYLVKVGSGTLTVTGTGTTRTATASSGTPFTSDDDNADITLCGYIQTPQGLYAIPAYTSDTVVSITTPSGYSNESTVAYSVWKYQFSSNTGAITSLNTDYQPVQVMPVRSEITTIVTDKLGEIIFGTSNNTTDIYWTHNGTANYSHFHSPLAINHNEIVGLQGGTADEYYHLTSAQHTIATQVADTDNSGYLSTSDWDTFNNKQVADAALTSISGLTYVSDSFIKLTATDTYAVRTIAQTASDLGLDDKANKTSWVPLVITTDFDDDPASSSTITMNSDQTGNIKKEMPIRFTLGGGAANPGTYYAKCTAITSGLLTIAGAPLEIDDGDLTALAYDPVRSVVQVDLFIASTYGDAVDTNLQSNDMNNIAVWLLPDAYCIEFAASHSVVDSGTEPKVNLRIDDAIVSTNDSNNGIQLGAKDTLVYNSAVAINTTNYKVTKGDLLTPACTVAGGSADAADLSMPCVFVLE